eukprot:4070019-Prymnesium_polylepis.1
MHADGTADVKFSDGETIKGLKQSSLRLLDPYETPAAPPPKPPAAAGRKRKAAAHDGTPAAAAAEPPPPPAAKGTRRGAPAEGGATFCDARHRMECDAGGRKWLTCDGCGDGIAPGAPRLSCAACDFDLCSPLGKGTGAGSAAERSAPN